LAQSSATRASPSRSVSRSACGTLRTTPSDVCQIPVIGEEGLNQPLTLLYNFHTSLLSSRRLVSIFFLPPRVLAHPRTVYLFVMHLFEQTNSCKNCYSQRLSQACHFPLSPWSVNKSKSPCTRWGHCHELLYYKVCLFRICDPHQRITNIIKAKFANKTLRCRPLESLFFITLQGCGAGRT
jgi:hypothetical protein